MGHLSARVAIIGDRRQFAARRHPQPGSFEHPVAPGKEVGSIAPEPGRVGRTIAILITVCAQDQAVVGMAVICKYDQAHGKTSTRDAVQNPFIII